MSGHKRSRSSPAAVCGENVQLKSPAEFFSENQNIAGFDNPGKSLYTTIRELVENSLDAAESIGRLPDISIELTEYTATQFRAMQGMQLAHNDDTLYQAAHVKSPSGAKKKSRVDSTGAPGSARDTAAGGAAAAGAAAGAAAPVTSSTPAKRGGMHVYKVVVTDNGCGMPHDDMPFMLGRVLTGSKYGVRQTRGKFGLGSKMALIWSRKSTGMPVTVRTAHEPALSRSPPAQYTFCVLDIDIYKNEPRIIQHERRENVDGMRGSQLELMVEGAWSHYKSKVMQYMQQLAVITPYADFAFTFQRADTDEKSFTVRWARRSTAMPPPAPEVRHHPSAVNNLVVRGLLHGERRPSCTVAQFLHDKFQCIPKPLAARLVAELGWPASKLASSMSTTDVTMLTQLLREAHFAPPDSEALSPAGEYNLRLGILKELAPSLLATCTSPVGVYDGHPFVIEAAIALGGKASREGVTVYRFANRIPLLWEGGGDVATRTALTRIPWGSYKIDMKRDAVAVFCSIVSTKIPFKGTGKEYIGDDILPIQHAVKAALQACASQLRTKLVLAASLRDRKNRAKGIVKYIPNVAKSVHGLLLHVAQARAAGAGAAGASAAGAAGVSEQQARMSEAALLSGILSGSITQKAFEEALHESVSAAQYDSALAAEGASSSKSAGAKGHTIPGSVYATPVPGSARHEGLVLAAPGFTFRLPAASSAGQ